VPAQWETSMTISAVGDSGVLDDVTEVSALALM
jgi:hypothetical protein